VSRQSDGAYAVRVRGPRSETSHVVSVPEALAHSLGLADLPGEELVRASFAILPRFSLDIISRYFPEYPTELRQYLA
jgi:hypothetical protein